MEHERFIARRRARFDGIDGKVNIPYGTALTCQDGFLMHKNQRVCAVGSQNGMDCFVQDDDGNGTLRGELVGNIQRCLERRDADYQTRWNRVWASALCQKYRRPESEDYWLWARAFFDLEKDVPLLIFTFRRPGGIQNPPALTSSASAGGFFV